MFNLHFGIERWKYNKEYNVYVSNYGNIKDKSKKIIYPKAYNNYLYVIIKHNFIPVHRLVLETFNPNQENLTVDHIDHNTKITSYQIFVGFLMKIIGLIVKRQLSL
jgi:hypothetical protein